MGGANFTSCRMERIICRGGMAPKALFRGALLTQADLSNSDLSDGDFQGADLTETNLHGVNREGADFTGSTIDLARATDPELLAAETWQPPPLVGE